MVEGAATAATAAADVIKQAVMNTRNFFIAVSFDKAPVRWTVWFDILMLSVVSSQQTSKGEVLIQLWPVNAIG